MVWRGELVRGAGEGDDFGELPLGYVDAFLGSMPARYRVLFDVRTVRRHAGVAYRRGGSLAYAEVWRALPDGSAALCVVADDRPGLLSVIAAALVSHRLDVITALVFSRPRHAGGERAGGSPHAREAVDLFWVRRSDSHDSAPIDATEAASIGQVVNALLGGQISIDEIQAGGAPRAPGEAPSVVVRFEEADEEGSAVLVVEAPDRPGMLLTVTRELFKQGAEIVRSLVRTVDGRIFNRFELAEASGGVLGLERRAHVQTAVLAAIEARESRTTARG